MRSALATLTLPGGEAIAYDDRGRGPVVVLVHGSPGTSRAWQRVGDRLSDRFRVVAPDLPRADAESDNSSAAAVIEALVAHVGAPAVLAGHSHGGVVALAAALRGRIAPGALALFEPVAVSIFHTAGDLATLDAVKAVFDGYIAAHEAGDPEAARIMVDYWFGPGAYARLPAAMMDYLRENTGRNVRDVRATFRDRYTLEGLGRLPMPVTLVVGARSPAVTLEIARTIASLVPRGTLTTLDGADHALTTTHPEAVADLIAGLAGAS